VRTVNGAQLADQAVIKAGSVAFTGACAIFSGSGYIQSDSVTFTQGATLNPGNSPGIMVFSGDLILENVVTKMELAGANPGTGHDYINILGRFVIGENAVLNVDAIAGFVPETGQTFNLFDFDPAKLEGDFAAFINGTGRNYVCSPSTGVLVTLGVENGTGSQQAVDLANSLSMSGTTMNEEMSSVLGQLISAGTAGDQFVGDAFGGNLVPALAAANLEDGAEIYARFTPEGYGGVYEYAYRSLGFGRALVDQVDLTTGSKVYGDMAFSNQGICVDFHPELSRFFHREVSHL
jgi:fibronectin-binding autotransporter adhesin